MNKRLFKALTLLLAIFLPLTLVACKKKGNDPERQITEIKLSTPLKEKYFVGDELNVSELKINVFYDDNSSSEVDLASEMVSGFDSSSVGERKLTITYGGKNIEVDYKVVNPSAIKLVLKTTFVTDYFQKDEINTAGGVISVHFDKGDPQDVPVTSNMISEFDNETVGTRKLKLSYLGVSIEVEYTIKKLEITEISISKAFKTEYFVGETLDISGGEITIKYNSNKTEKATVTKDMVSGFDSSTAGTKILKITHKGSVCEVPYRITAIVLEKIEVSTSFKTEYFVGETLDISGGKIKLTFNNKNTQIKDIDADMVSGFSSETPTENGEITITYGSKQTTVKYKIIAIVASKLEVCQDFKNEYFVGEELDLTGGKVKITYNNGSTEERDITIDMVSGFPSSKIGENELTIKVEDIDPVAHYTYILKDIVATEISLKTPFKTNYYKDEPLDLTGGEITVKYSDNSEKDVLISSIFPRPTFNSSFVRENKKMTIKYEGLTLDVYYNVYSISIELKTDFKTTYSVGEELDITDRTLLVTLGDKDEPEEIAITADMISNFNTETAGTFELTITYKSAKLKIGYTVA